LWCGFASCCALSPPSCKLKSHQGELGVMGIFFWRFRTTVLILIVKRQLNVRVHHNSSPKVVSAGLIPIPESRQYQRFQFTSRIANSGRLFDWFCCFFVLLYLLISLAFL
jgi:hypothetical protein